MADEGLFGPQIVSRPAGPPGLGRRAVAAAMVTAGYLALAGGALLVQLLVVESVQPPRAFTTSLLIFRPPPAGSAAAGSGGGRSGPATSTAPAIHPPPVRPVVVPLAPPMETSDAGTAAWEPGAGVAGSGGPGGPGDGSGPGGGAGCPGCVPGGTGIGPGGGDEMYREDAPGIEPPVLIASSRALPKYPDMARRARVQGTVVLLVVIDRDGRVGEIEVLRSPDPRFGFDLAAVEAVKQWRYRPALLGGRTVTVQASVMVEFTLSR